MNFDWKQLVKTVAPALGSALGGPVGGVAAKFIADKFLGNPQASEEEIAQAIMHASPEQLVKLKEIDRNFELEMNKLNVDVYRIDFEDRDSARKRQVELKDWTPTVIAFLFITGYFSMIFYMLKNELTQAEEVLIARAQDIIMLIMAYFFGSSSGSRIKDYMIGRKQENNKN